MKHIVVECGRSSVVTVAHRWVDERTKPFILPAFVGEKRQRNITNERLDTEIELVTSFGSFFVGDLARAESHGAGRLMTKSKIHDDTKVLILASVARAVPDGESVVLTTNLPIEQHSAGQKKALANLLRGEHAVVINGTKKRFVIERVNVGAEGAAAYMFLCRGQGGTRRFIDLGSRMMNYATVRNGRYIDRESGSLNYGCDTVKGANLVHRVVSDLSAAWADFNDWTYLLGGGAYKHSEGLARYFPRLMCAAYPVLTNSFALFEIGEGAMANAARVD